MKTVRIALMAMLTTLALAAGASAGQELDFIWTDIEDEYDSDFNQFIVWGDVETPAVGETTDGENIIMLTRPGTPDQTYTLDSIDGSYFQIISPDDPANGSPLPAAYVLLAYDSAGNYDGYGGTAE